MYLFQKNVLVQETTKISLQIYSRFLELGWSSLLTAVTSMTVDSTVCKKKIFECYTLYTIT